MRGFVAIHFVGCGDSTHRCRRRRHRGQASSGERIYYTTRMNKLIFGAVGAAITGILLLGESASLARIASLGLIVAGIIGLKLSTH